MSSRIGVQASSITARSFAFSVRSLILGRHLFAVLLILTAPLSAAELPPAEKVLDTLQPDHPRLLANARDFARLQSSIKSDPQLATWKNSLKRDAEKILTAALPTHHLPDGKRLLKTSQEMLRRTSTLGLVFRLTGDERLKDKLWEDLQAVAAFPDWNPRHFLDTAEMTFAFALAYDWLYHDWTAAQRTTLRTALVRHGLQPGLDCYRGHAKFGWWTAKDHNWNQVCNSGLAIGALAIAEHHADLAAEIVHAALVSHKKPMARYAPDGGYVEGHGYWGFGTAHTVYLLAALQTAVGTDFGISESTGFDRTGLFPIHTTGPFGRTFNFADDGRGHVTKRIFVLHWLGTRFDNSLLNWIATKSAGKDPVPFDLLWYRGPGQSLIDSVAPRCKYFRGPEVVTLRGSWDDDRTTYVAAKAGQPNVNHGQADVGSFVLDALGQRWVVDLGKDGYNLPGYFDRSDQRWTYYRNRAEGHNTLVISPDETAGQVVAAHCRVTRFEPQPGGAVTEMDLTSAYAPSAQKVVRRIELKHNRDVVIHDRIQLKAAAEVLWIAHTPAQVDFSSDNREATLRQGGQQLMVQLQRPADAVFSLLPAGPLASSPDPTGQRKNEGVSRLVVQLANFTTGDIQIHFHPSATDKDR